MQVTNLVVVLKLLPRREARSSCHRVKDGLSAWIGQEEQLASIYAEKVCESADNLVGRMPPVRLQMADVRCRGFDATGHLLLRKIELSATLANQVTKRAFIRP